MLTVQDGFTRFASAYPICNKEAGTVARVLIHEHFSVFGLPNQIHSDNGAEFVNKLWSELFSELKILHTRTPPYNPNKQGTVSQLYSKPRRFRSSWSQRIFRTMLTLMLFISSVCSVGGNSDWRELAFKIRAFDCNAPTMINKLHLPDVCFIPEKKWPEKLAEAKPAWILGEEYVHELPGVVCSATISRFRGYCGAYSHWKFMDVPEIEGEEPVTLEQCKEAK